MSRYTPTEVPLDLIAGDQLELAAQHGQPVTIKVKVGGYRAMLPLTKVQIDKLKMGGRSIRLTPAHLSYLRGRGMCGRGIFGDVGKAIGPAVGSAASAALSAIPGVGPLASIAGPFIGEAIGAIGQAIDRGVEKKSYNEEQSAKNFNAAITKAKAFLAMSPRQQMQQYERMKKVPFLKVGSFEQYVAKMEQQAAAEKTTTAQQLEKRLAKKGLGSPVKLPKVLKKKQRQGTTSGALAADYIQAALAGKL